MKSAENNLQKDYLRWDHYYYGVNPIESFDIGYDTDDPIQDLVLHPHYYEDQYQLNWKDDAFTDNYFDFNHDGRQDYIVIEVTNSEDTPNEDRLAEYRIYLGAEGGFDTYIFDDYGIDTTIDNVEHYFQALEN